MAKVPLTTEGIPTELKSLPQWVCWQWKDKRDGERTKVPCTTSGSPASSTNQETWTTFDDAYQAYRIFPVDGIGFVFTPEDPYCGLDLDDCIAGGVLREPEGTYVKLLNSYTEISPSGTGVKVIFRGTLPDGSRHGFGEGNGVYDSSRFFTITGHVYGQYGSIRTPSSQELQTLFGAWFPVRHDTVQWEEQPERYTDNEVWNRASDAANSEKFLDLWYGRWSTYYPSKSEADAGLCAMLAFYTGTNPGQIDRLFRNSLLYTEKWDERRGEGTYGERTINYVLDNMETYYGGGGDVAGGDGGDSGAGVPALPLPVVAGGEPKWRRMMVGYPALEEREMPWALRRIVQHLGPLAEGFECDWAEMMAIGYISSLFPRVRFENLPLMLWPLGISEQATGKSLVGDELAEIVYNVGDRKGTPLAKYGSGSTAGLIRRLAGDRRAMLAYFSEWSSLIGEMERDFASTMKDTLLNLYDGRSQVHQLAQESIVVDNPRLVVAGVTTVENWTRVGNMSSIADGFYSRLFFVAPDAYAGYLPQYRRDLHDNRERLIRELGNHWATLPEFEGAAFEGGEFPKPLVDYMRHLGMVHEGPKQLRDLDDALLRTSNNEMPGGRAVVKVKKVASLLALCEKEPYINRGTLWVQDEHIQMAVRLTQRSNGYATRVFGYLARSKDENQANSVRLALRRNGVLKLGSVMHEAALNRTEAEKALNLLIDDGEAESIIVDGVRHWGLK